MVNLKTKVNKFIEKWLNCRKMSKEKLSKDMLQDLTDLLDSAKEDEQNHIIRIIKGRLLIKTIRQSIIRIIKHTDE